MQRLVVLVVLCIASIAHAQPASVPSHARAGGAIEDEPPFVDVLTFGVGDRIFEKFGHAAICLRYHDPRHATVCFNYGVTNFDAGPILIWRFLRSEQKFWVEPSPLGTLWTGSGSRRGVLGFYSWEDRDIWVQTLPLAAPQARAVENYLWDSLDEARRYYLYDHFLDNCTTRLRDLIDDAVGGKLRAGGDARYPLTFRELGHRGLAELPALVALSDFVMGRQLDQHPTLWQAMFHPDVLRQQIEVQLGATPRLLYARKGPAFPANAAPGAGRLGMLAIAVAFTLPLLLARWRRRFEKLGLIVATAHLVFWGLLVWSVVVLSPIEGVRWNEAVLVVMPFDIVLPFLGEARRRTYARVRVALLALVSALCAIGVLAQPLWIPLLVVLLPMSILAFDLPRSLVARREARDDRGDAAAA